MESSIVAKNWAIMGLLVLSWVSMANSESIQDCYSTCFVVCAVTPGISFSDCPSRCLHSCITPSNSSMGNTDVHSQQKNHFYCELGCATSWCTKYSTKENPAAKEVGSCVDSCSHTCSLN
ncbi:unnamed protein product [Citrullus colocynthis]|uniref:Thionin-like protein 2 n=1 Tax=Citrullus colocynthis TaxID=252529 RepID=A0ABP0XQL6_9ROSI